MSVRILSVIGLAACLGCSQAPLPAGLGAGTGNAGGFPDLVPISNLLALAPAGGQTADRVAGDIASRIAGLRGRAAGLTGPVVDPATRTRMQAAIARAALR